MFRNTDIIPVIAPIGVGDEGQTYNINADTAAGAIGGALRARKLLLLTDVRGVLDLDKQFIPTMTSDDARRLIATGAVTGGMIPKLDTCLEAVDRGVDAAVILDGRVPHALLLELFTEHGFGTQISAGSRIGSFLEFHTYKDGGELAARCAARIRPRLVRAVPSVEILAKLPRGSRHALDLHRERPGHLRVEHGTVEPPPGQPLPRLRRDRPRRQDLGCRLWHGQPDLRARGRSSGRGNRGHRPLAGLR